MSKVFKRPMFRKGGEVMGGIMNGIKPRQNFQEGMSAKERLLKVSEEYPTGGFDPLTQFLIQGGLSLISQPKRDGTLATIAEAVKEPTQQLFTGMAKRGSRARDIALAGEQLDIAAEQAQRLAEIKARQKDFFAAETPEAQFEVLFKGYTDANSGAIRQNARNLASFEVYKASKKPGYVQVSFTQDKKGKYKADFSVLQPNQYTYDPITNRVYQMQKDRTVIELDPINLQPLENVDGTES